MKLTLKTLLGAAAVIVASTVSAHVARLWPGIENIRSTFTDGTPVTANSSVMRMTGFKAAPLHVGAFQN